MAQTPLPQAAAEFEAILTGVGDLSADDLEGSLEAAAEILIDEWRPRIPERTGQLRDSPTFETQHKDLSEVLVAVGPNKDGWYFHFVELGTAHSSPQPSLRPAFDANIGRMLGAIARELDTLLFTVGRF